MHTMVTVKGKFDLQALWDSCTDDILEPTHLKTGKAPNKRAYMNNRSLPEDTWAVMTASRDALPYMTAVHAYY